MQKGVGSPFQDGETGAFFTFRKKGPNEAETPIKGQAPWIDTCLC